MKNHILIFTLLVIQSVFSQVEYGVTGGLQSSRFSNEFETIGGKYLNFDNPGISLGGYLEYDLLSNISLYGKINFLQIGDRENGGVVPDQTSADTIDYRLNYVSIPLNVKFFNKFYLYLGPQINVLINYEFNELDFGSPGNGFDIGANIGFGYDFGKIRLESMFYQGFSNLLEFEPAFNGASPLLIRNTYINLNLSYQISK